MVFEKPLDAFLKNESKLEKSKKAPTSISKIAPTSDKIEGERPRLNNMLVAKVPTTENERTKPDNKKRGPRREERDAPPTTRGMTGITHGENVVSSPAANGSKRAVNFALP